MNKGNERYLKNKIRGALYGVAVGDALGAPLEFMEEEEIRDKYGRVTTMIGGGWLNVRPGEVTDDTQMTMAVALGIEENPEDPVPAIGRRFIEWYNGGPKDVGGTCEAAIREAINTHADTRDGWMFAGDIVGLRSEGRNAGNGALMRTIYPAVYYADSDLRRGMTRDIGRMTHSNHKSILACIEYADAVHAAIFGSHPLYTVDPEHLNRFAPPSGYVLDSWSNALYAIIFTESFRDAVIEAVNRGGDADTIGAITGGLAGAYYGYDAIPEEWIDKLDESLKRDMDRLADVAYNSNVKYYANKYNLPE